LIPIKDDNPTPIVPFVTIGLVVVNSAVYLHQLFLPAKEAEMFVYTYGAVPAFLIKGVNLYSPFTSMFLHGSLLHLFGNMLYLWIFGDNIEHICGHVRFFFFYVVCGLVAFFSHFITEPASTMPMIGASGAISGVLGAYILRFPRANVYVFFWFFFIFMRIIPIPAFVVLGFWFFINILNGLFSGASGGNVAWFAHIGGFIAGLLLIRMFEKKKYQIYYR
jgi:membrane associated rhomboid family serine protease